MVTFNRRYRSAHKGYSREDTKRDFEIVLDREFSSRGLPRDFDDRGVAGLVFGDRVTSERIPHPIEPDRPWPPFDALADLAAWQPHVRASTPERSGLRAAWRWVTSLFRST